MLLAAAAVSTVFSGEIEELNGTFAPHINANGDSNSKKKWKRKEKKKKKKRSARDQELSRSQYILVVSASPFRNSWYTGYASLGLKIMGNST